MLSCWLDPALPQMRQALNIPVVGVGQSSMLFANSMGDKFSLISQNDIIIPQLKEIIERSGLQSKVASIRPITLPDEEHVKSLGDAHALIADFQNVSRQCIADGAEVILVGCMLVATVLAVAPKCEKEYPNGLQEIDGVPVVDNLAVMLKATESVVAVKNAGFPWISRKQTYSCADSELEANSRAPFLDDTPAYFTLIGT